MAVEKFIGTIHSLNKNKAYGHLTPNWAINNDDNIFFHFSRTVPHKCFLEPGKEVLFQLEKDNKGRWMAIELLDIKYCPRTDIINRARMMKQRPDFLPDSCIMREDRQRVKKEDARVDRAKKEGIIKEMEQEDTSDFLASLIPSKEV